MDTALPQKFPFILDRNLAKANRTGNRVSTSCDIASSLAWKLKLYDRSRNRSKVPEHVFVYFPYILNISSTKTTKIARLSM